ncbi:MAG: tRNA (adenosine(37)-N6)-threonylcarbamoyltransferase complex dimerization subunit type 1 TsaB [Hydrogenophaga sp.]|uniref:tRNA (adenosine(37)-N6)-threonylcarbamoyltransferase complex dimerization subunit type 1 TsaB n=1 Tax=Hydrogenophaga sp. TaxID=1904254 RepID=UPI0016AE0211|nr:tRNA (adenosine(37)-N6)-threonylcarbamoyltransferase complex dimerization subunit type 1 TsaB [Hydrogenophaga sp.]NIM40900.1 tRNA (adenosine(37)-N6)-threonylcarbamoyltransferase complex dimerization subunit type 1 TsaB [Hydrogenophaga sp.]NIN24742.1 tRNA (adenosine(37)-N6)-threonylcarbamoyltransferase complex dimerization subunit type 1 TsaB [Hydrogenophaga sp.]NIN29254.1 tRNA (adenosine(37)-N6)-threonylcarbamoyltransferase complex dimerization subunit type 1 TsaB [Hydrogenophaga sp.]NIN5377
MPAAPCFLAIETSTDTLSLALGTGRADDTSRHFQGPGGAQASTELLPQVRRLLADADLALGDLEAIAFGRGPGSFTGLRTACAVAQGLAYGTRGQRHPQGLPVLPVDTLLALAEQARADDAADGHAAPTRIVALLDARMDELYLAAYALERGKLRAITPPRLCAPADLAGWLHDQGFADDDRTLLAGNAFGVYAEALRDAPGRRRHALPTAEALLRLAPALMAQGAAVSAAEALPLYVRDKVARTTAEREGKA